MKCYTMRVFCVFIQLNDKVYDRLKPVVNAGDVSLTEFDSMRSCQVLSLYAKTVEHGNLYTRLMRCWADNVT